MRVQFWGTRGSIAKPGPTTLRYGGNTSCVEVETAAGARIVLDCGTGAHGLGQALVGAGVSRGHLLISHTHWDHIQGFPFFEPLFIPGNEWDIYAPGAAGRGLEEVLRGQMEYTYFPVTLDQLAATIRFHDLGEGSFDLGEVRVTTRYLNHPAVALGYRLEAGGVTVVYSTDHEPHSRHQAAEIQPTEGGAPTLVHVEDERHAEFLAGADLLIHDAQYTAAEYAQKVGWGHSTVEYVVDLAVAAGVKRLALFHHDPLRADGALDQVLQICLARVRAWGASLRVDGAAEGEAIQFQERPKPAPERRRQSGAPTPARVEAATVLIVDDDPESRGALSAALQDEGYRLFSAADGRTALELARAARPDLVLLNWDMPGMDGISVLKALRREADPRLCTIPVVMVTAHVTADDTREGFEAGADDYLTKPFTSAHVRTRVREWLERRRSARVPS